MIRRMILHDTNRNYNDDSKGNKISRWIYIEEEKHKVVIVVVVLVVVVVLIIILNLSPPATEN